MALQSVQFSTKFSRFIYNCRFDADFFGIFTEYKQLISIPVVLGMRLGPWGQYV